MLSVSKLYVSSTTGSNKLPCGGWVTFSDGKHYDFFWNHADKYWYLLMSYKSAGGDHVRRRFASPKREAALAQHFNQ